VIAARASAATAPRPEPRSAPRPATRDAKYWAAILILLPLVLQRLFIGGTTGSYESYTGLNFAFVGYLVHIGFVGALLMSREPPRANISFLAVAALFLISLLQLLNATYLFNLSFITVGIPIARALLWVLAVYIYATRFFEPERFIAAFTDILKIAGLFILFCFLIYTATSIPLGVNIEKGLGRVHGTFSEPSTLACVFPAFTMIQLQRRRFLWAALGTFIVFAAASTIATGVFVLMLAIFVIQRSRAATLFAVFGTISFAVIMTLSLNGDVVANLDSIATSISLFLDQSIGPSAFRAYTIDRIPEALKALADYINSSTALDIQESGGLARFIGALTMLANMAQDGTTLYGYGLSVYGFVATALYGTVLDFGLYPYFLSSFGVVGGTVLLYLIGMRVAAWYNVNRILFLIFAGALLGTMYNSGGGIMAYSLPLLALLAPMRTSGNGGAATGRRTSGMGGEA
jgi:hypothetical protein